MLVNQASELFHQPGHALGKTGIIIGASFLGGLLIYVVIFPWIKNLGKPLLNLHKPLPELKNLEVPTFKRVAVALDFTEGDEKIIAYALSQGQTDTQYILIHIVESAASRLLGNSAHDLETQQDGERLLRYAEQLNERGFNAVPKLGFRNRVEEITRLVKENNTDLLVIGSHGHSGFKDYWHGETINKVRHEVKVPMLIVNL